MHTRSGIGRMVPLAICLALGMSATLGAHAAGTQAHALPNYAPDTARITGAIDSLKTVEVGAKPSLATSANDAGALSSTQQIRNVTLLLKRSDVKQKQFDAYVHALTNPSSPYFHHWLTPTQIGTLFGPAQADIAKINQWLQGQGLKVTSVSPTGMMIHFSGSAASVGNAFHTSLHNYRVNGETHFANANAQQIPVALAPVVVGAVSLSNFFPKPQHTDVATVTKDKHTGQWKTVAKAKGAPQFTVPPGTIDTQTTYDVAPADFATIYNVTPLWSQATPIRGAGQTVAVLERTDVLPADVQTFRSAFLPSNAMGTIAYINPLQSASDTSCTDPGTNGDEGEAALDTEWIGAAAPDANIVFASCNDANSATFGPFTAAENLLSGYNAPMPTVFSLSYGECEADGFMDGTAQQAGDLWEQAAAEGVTVFVSSNDAGSAGCNQDQRAAYEGLAVNDMASTPFNVAVGGTDFNDFTNYGQYWTSSNLSLNQSAISYVPEMTWNDSCASSVLDSLLHYSNGVQACNDPANSQFLSTGGGGGGYSTNWQLSLWQVGIYGAPAYGTRMLPDVSLFAANGLYGHALVFCMSDQNEGGTSCDYTNPDNVLYNSAGGTSFAAPAMAGVQALINQAAGHATGNILPALYSIASKEYGTPGSPNNAMLTACSSNNGASIGSACVFNNVTVGNNAVPCYAGTDNCYTGKGIENYGVLSAGGFDSLDPAWTASAGYNVATGLGSINAANLVNAVTNYYKPFRNGYSAPYDFLSSGNEAQGDGYSDIAVVDPVKGTFMQLGMKGSVVLNNITQSIPAGYTISAAGEFFSGPYNTRVTGTEIGALAWTSSSNQLGLWLSDGLGGSTNGASNYLMESVGPSYPAGWQLVGAGNFDNSGSDELFWWNPTTGQFGWWQLEVHVFYILGRAQYHFGTLESPVLNAATGYVPHLADVNGDGYADIVWTSTTDNSVYVWINNQNGGFIPHQIQNHAAGFTLFGAGDVAGNGITSLFWTNPTTNQMQVWNMNGFEVTSQQSFSVASGYTMASIADYDGDGLADVLWVGKAGDAYEWLSNGNGGFISQRVADASGNPLVIPAGAQVQPNRLQGGRVTSGMDTAVGITQ